MYNASTPSLDMRHDAPARLPSYWYREVSVVMCVVCLLRLQQGSCIKEHNAVIPSSHVLLSTPSLQAALRRCGQPRSIALRGSTSVLDLSCMGHRFRERDL